METLPFTPMQTGYSVSDGRAVIGVELDGGAGRYRLDLLNQTSRVSARWQLNEEKYLVFRSFYKGVIKEGSLPFMCNLVLDDPYPQLFVCRIIPNSIALTEHAGKAFVITSELEVEPIVRTQGYHESVFTLYRDYGSLCAGLDSLNILSSLVNVDLATTNE